MVVGFLCFVLVFCFFLGGEEGVLMLSNFW